MHNSGYSLKCYRHCDDAILKNLHFYYNKGISAIFYEKSKNITITAS